MLFGGIFYNFEQFRQCYFPDLCEREKMNSMTPEELAKYLAGNSLKELRELEELKENDNLVTKCGHH